MAYPKDVFQNSQLKQQSGKCFVLMPFNDQYVEIYQEICQALTGPELNFICSRADDIRRGGNVLEDVFQEIARSEIVIADLSGGNPNVFYELGIVQMVKDVKKVILLIQDTQVAPFDVAGFRRIIYKATTEGMDALRAALIAAVKEVAEEAIRFELRKPVKTYQLPYWVMGPDKIAYDFEIKDCAYVQKAVKIDLVVTRHVLGKQPEVFAHISDGLNENERIELPGLKWELHLERGTDEFARFVVKPQT